MSRNLYKSLRQIRQQAMSEKPAIAVGIRLKNEIAAIRSFWGSLKKQSFFNKTEIVFIDSGSTDGTLEFLMNIECTIYTISSDEFSFGSSCNLIMELTISEHVCFFSGHVIIQSSECLNYLCSYIKKNGDTSGYLRQVPNYITGYSIYDFTYLKYRFPAKRSQQPVLTKENVRFSNAASIVCRKHWDSVKFKNIRAGEDQMWASEAYKAGFKIIYFHMLLVLHSHNESCDEITQRVRLNANALFPNGVGHFKKCLAFIKVFASILLNSGNLKKATEFAYAHYKGYS
ncbi:MAG TPA: glycosyltransferase family A protein [Sphingobacteriaceae bacterium]|nr:glycosyltransferase family A protein [Sphingobacteriaceae bacterium]